MWASVLSDDVELLDADEALLEDPTARLNRGAGPPCRGAGLARAARAAAPRAGGRGARAAAAARPARGGGARPSRTCCGTSCGWWRSAGARASSCSGGPPGAAGRGCCAGLCTRADEVGAARVVWSDGAVGGLAATVPQLLRVGDRSGAAREEWLREVLHEPELVGPALAFLDDTLPEGVRGGVGARLLGRTDRSTVLCLDDCDRAPADLSVVAELLAGRGPILVAVAVDDHEADSAFRAGPGGAGRGRVAGRAAVGVGGAGPAVVVGPARRRPWRPSSKSAARGARRS
jgi:hypothetical protein